MRVALALVLLAFVSRAETVTLPATQNAGISMFRPGTVNKEGEWNLSWSGRDGKQTLRMRQNQNWAGFENYTILLKFDMAAIKGWTVSKATLHLALAEGELYGVGACSILNDWKEGTQHGVVEPGAPCWNYRASPQKDQKPAAEHLWAWPGSQFYSVTWLHPALRYSHAGPSQIERYTDADGVRWIKFPIEPDLVHAMAIGASYGMVLTDDKGQVAEAYMLEKNPKPYVYDPSFEIHVYSRHAKEGKLAPKLEVVGQKIDTTAPKRVTVVGEPTADEFGRVRIKVIAPSLLEAAPMDRSRACAYRVQYRSGEKDIFLPVYELPLPAEAKHEQTLTFVMPPGKFRFEISAIDAAGNASPASDAVLEVPERKEWKLTGPKIARSLSDLTGSDKRFQVSAVSDAARIDPITGPGAEVEQFTLSAARNEVISFQLIVRASEPVKDVQFTIADLKGPEGAAINAVNVEFFREWYVKAGEKWVADALLPLAAPFETTFSMPNDNIGEKQLHQVVWVDVYVPRDAVPGNYTGRIKVNCAEPAVEADIGLHLQVRNFALPDEFTFPIELNTYNGMGGFAGVDINKERERYLKIERSYYQLAHKHRCVFNVLRYTHSGRLTENAVPPVIDGEPVEYTGGRSENWRQPLPPPVKVTRRIADWKDFDERFGPLLDGTAFSEAAGYRGPGMNTPVPQFYLPFHENYPLEFDKYYKDTALFPDRKTFAEWAKKSERLDLTVAPEYSAGFRAVVAQTIKHLDEKKWHRTAFHFFLNNKYYYKCPFFVDPGTGMTGGSGGKCYWLLDEPIDYDDMDANRFFLSLCQQGVKDSGAKNVQVRYRTDVSNPHMVRGLWDGVVNEWCCSFLHEVNATARVRQKWLPEEKWSNYGGGIGVGGDPAQQTGNFLTRYSCGALWVLPFYTNFGDRNWRNASDTSIYYTGANYAGTNKTYDGALPGIRMKILRRAQQDMEYLNLLAGMKGWSRDGVIEALRPWADNPESVTGLSFTKMDAAKLAKLREAVAATIEKGGDK
ncbi:MAG TPA: glycoside hydrolase domain-containing protein [Planctomycetota bacterium]|nr:glycoside hydrolase domain-containing protein [Planctomycetota bacterium]